jgi:hypothetical protein
MAADKPVSNYEEVFEDGEEPKEAQTVHRIRANSTIMQLNKILGECPWGTGAADGGCERASRESCSRRFPLTQRPEMRAVANRDAAQNSRQQR